MLRIILFIFLIIFLTMTTQIGGAILLLSWIFCRLFIKQMRFLATTIIFVLLYCIMSFVGVPAIAPYFGRVQLPCSSSTLPYEAGNKIYCLTNRNYVTPDTKDMLEHLSTFMSEKYPGTITLYLDGNFPFIDRFPLVPHLSHNDGKKIDIAFYYQNGSSIYEPGLMRSPIGYFGFEPIANNATSTCEDTKGLTLRWDFAWLQPLLTPAYLDEERTKTAIEWLTTSGVNQGVEKIFIEPHLKQQMNLSSDIIRFQGCRAARHDDHIHIQMR